MNEMYHYMYFLTLSLTVLGPMLLIWSCHIKRSWSSENTEYQLEEKSTIEYEYSTEVVDYSGLEIICEKGSIHTFRAWFLPTIYTIICLLALVGNFLIILTYLYFKRLKTMTDVYLLNLAMADMLFAISLPFWAASSMRMWYLGLYTCKAMFTIYKVSFFSGMFLLTCISIDCYFSITKAVSAHRCCSSAVYYGQVSSLLVWVMAVIFSVPDMVFSEVNVSMTCVASGSNYDDYRIKILVSQMILGFIIPAVVIGFCYICIIKTLNQAKNFERNKAIKVIIAVIAVFVFSQLPYIVVMGVTTQETMECNKDSSLYAMDVTRAVAFLRCCVNPFLYAFIGVNFRNDLRKLLKDLGCIK
ncbi:C-C chemokine receptor type 7-like isoform X1 [Megalobrama amblycephala]|uniref:C-C chemokine receptor type 7-like isoform X1 n=1 Tax=Megalobrama amblycephala TaxID=75352 RepID=UPI002014721B|nr:C-C chemokine receptor type 7-like isoform X1 [Megalobrama amblycephala]